jgi:hypothetical protein
MLNGGVRTKRNVWTRRSEQNNAGCGGAASVLGRGVSPVCCRWKKERNAVIYYAVDLMTGAERRTTRNGLVLASLDTSLLWEVTN